MPTTTRWQHRFGARPYEYCSRKLAISGSTVQIQNSPLEVLLRGYFENRVLLKIYFVKAQAGHHAAHRGTRVLLSSLQDTVFQRRLAQLPLSFLPDPSFQIRVGRYQQPGLTRIHPGFLVIEGYREYLRFGKFQGNVLTMQGDVRGTNCLEVDARHNLPVH